MTQLELATMLNVSKATASKWLNGGMINYENIVDYPNS